MTTTTSTHVSSASDVGVFTMLESAPAHPADVAEQLALNPRGTSQLLEALALLGLLAVTSEGYVPTVTHSARAAAAAHMWDALPETVRTGTGPHHVNTTVGAEAMYQDVVGFLSDLTGPVAEAVAKHLVDEAVPADVLEVGSGAAPWSRAVARQAPSAHITALDLPSILPITRQQVEDDGLDRQFKLPAGGRVHRGSGQRHTT
jgi:hypothetical protein